LALPALLDVLLDEPFKVGVITQSASYSSAARPIWTDTLSVSKKPFKEPSTSWPGQLPGLKKMIDQR